MCLCEEDDPLKQGLINISSEREVKHMYIIGVALFSFGIGLFGGWKLMREEDKK
mgnify:FL=1